MSDSLFKPLRYLNRSLVVQSLPLGGWGVPVTFLKSALVVSGHNDRCVLTFMASKSDKICCGLLLTKLSFLIIEIVWSIESHNTK